MGRYIYRRTISHRGYYLPSNQCNIIWLFKRFYLQSVCVTYIVNMHMDTVCVTYIVCVCASVLLTLFTGIWTLVELVVVSATDIWIISQCRSAV